MKSPPRSRYNVGFLIAVGLAFHYVYMSSIFDCYFSSTVSNGMSPVTVPSNLAKRLVLIIGDGVRADLLFSLNPFDNIPGSPRIVAPYLRSVMEHSGAFGISHTRVPTLTRPGHVAIIGERFDAGMYEDMSTISKGWTSEPVEFDSIFNQSSTTFSFGFPSVQSMFSRRAAPGKIRDWCYEDGEQDYTKDASALDFWVLENLQRLFRNSTDDPILSSQLNADKTVFFLRLGGLDITGHSYRPHSKEYMNNIRAVDRIVERSQSLFNEYFQDSQTSFIFTADHGMSVTGVHGDGHPDNTRTPLIAWGAGIRGPLPDSSPSSHDEYSQPWGLNHLLRRDIEQADITALMATLLGLQWPAHSVGILPDADSSRPGYLALSAGEETVARASIANANALLEHYRVKHVETNQGRRLFYKPFERLEGRADNNIAVRASMLQRTQTAMDANDWKNVHNESLVLIQAALEGIRYLQTYDSFLIHVIVTAGYVGWAAYSSLYISRPLDQSLSQRASPRASTTITVLVTLVLCCSWAVFALQHSPWTYYIYISFPCFFWRQFLLQTPWRFIPPTFRYSQCTITALLVFVALQGITVCRSILSAGEEVLTSYPLAMMALAVWVTYGSVQSLQAKSGLPILNQYLGWILRHTDCALVASPLLAVMLGAKFGNALTKTTAYLIGFGVWLVVLSVNAEGLFYLAYAMTLQIWIEVETTLRNEQPVANSGEYRSLRLDDLRIAIFFLFFSQCGFFGAGNVASIVSFYLEPVYRLVITFKPFLVFGLLMGKAVIPYVILSVSLATLNARLHLPPFSILLVALPLTDVVTLTFFYQVSDVGSWTEIDQPIGRFCVMSLLLLWSMGICAAGEYLMADPFRLDREKVD
ncbi:hypothetical protein PLEOSDRAFT_1032825 [Pleurotus ostreatus PC15]|uniref:GPI ethanolamine phosphate transferase 1 n=1 Tax=Pleurotus ostreatus (strain PC15) TaxID=1137138 RepID=A0A067PDI5_PLEO1|nr:hypothetical protein PLEOSDRAFT_1032825 [Pleurotus ostreatus PC15]